MNIPKIIINFDSNCYTCQKSISVVPSLGGCACTSAQIPAAAATPNSPCVDCDTACDDVFESDCTQYSAGDIPALAITNGEMLTSIIIKLSAEIIALKQQVATLI